MRDIRLPIVQKVDDISDVGWRKTTSKCKNRSTLYYPCIRLSRDEARLMFPDGLKPKNIGVRFLGSKWKNATQWQQVRPSTFYPLHKAWEKFKDEGASGCLSMDDDTCLERFLDQEFGDAPENAVKRRVEEIIIRRSWEHVIENQKAKEEDQEKEDEKDANASAEALAGGSQPGSRDVANDSEGGTSDHESSIVFFSQSRRKRDLLRPGEIVQYYLPGRVAGNPDVLRQSVILGINPRNNFPLNLESGDFLEKDHKIRRTLKRVRGKMVEESNALFRHIGSYSLRRSGTDEAVAFLRKVQNMKRTRDGHSKAMDDFWQGPIAKGLGDGRDAANGLQQARDSMEQAEKCPKQSRSTKNALWRKDLTKLLEETEANMKNKRRFVPKISPAELRTLMKVWSVLEKRGELDNAVQALGKDLNISEMRAEAMLFGDPRNKLSKANKLEIMRGMEAWLGNEEGEA